jgi:hypothetical protein
LRGQQRQKAENVERPQKVVAAIQLAEVGG